MRKLKIHRNTNGDSRVATKVPTFSEFNDSNFEHCENVRIMMINFSKDIQAQGGKHDWTKIEEPYRSMFYRDMCNAIEGRMKFEDGEWSKLHYATERHHLLRNVPNDVNLIDVIEMIADCVCAGMARSGEVRPLEIDEFILMKAIDNTVKLMAESIELQEDGEQND